MSQSLLDRPSVPGTRLGLIDCDVHHAMRSPRDLDPYLAQKWRDHLGTYGSRKPVPFTGTSPYFKSAPALSRKDTWPPNGGPPGSDLAFLQEQLLDRYGIECGMLHLLSMTGMDQRNQEFGAALCRAVNHWQHEVWTQKDRRLKAAIVVPGEDAAAAVQEIEYWAGNRDFAQVSMVTHTIEPLGRRRYWPIYEAAAAHDLPIGLHTSGFNGHAVTPTGWSSYYAEEHHEVAISQQALVTSLVCEGVLARLPSLRVVMVECGLAWVPSLCWRLDQHWKRMRDEVPHLDGPPSSYVKSQMWFTTQPMDEPERPADLSKILEWIGWDRILFATDYPHWDFDDPETAVKVKLTETQRRMIFRDNARAAYNL
ncbi:MAG TPA: amidohydrolase family protein [Acetobacteraceae bacterium]|nr:amidohydrolase family protein [Acetobacteraceae bacterium]